MTTKEGQLTWAAKRAMGMTNSVKANQRRLHREPTVIDWDERIANLLDILDDTYPATGTWRAVRSDSGRRSICGPAKPV